MVVLAHDNPAQVRRLIGALDPLPVFLHVDASTPDDQFTSMTRGLPDRVDILPRLKAGWAHPNVLAAELAGYRRALATTDATHLILATGADYPLASVAAIHRALDDHPGSSVLDLFRLPHSWWGRLRGYDRFVFRHWVWRRRRLWLPIPRRIPSGLVPAGGSQTKILTREHAQRLLEVWDEYPRLGGYFRSCWTPEEVAIPTLLSTTRLGIAEPGEVIAGQHPWFIDWGPARSPSPRWLTEGDLPALSAARHRPGFPALFARKFGDASGPVLDLIDRELRAEP